MLGVLGTTLVGPGLKLRDHFCQDDTCQGYVNGGRDVVQHCSGSARVREARMESAGEHTDGSVEDHLNNHGDGPEHRQLGSDRLRTADELLRTADELWEDREKKQNHFRIRQADQHAPQVRSARWSISRTVSHMARVANGHIGQPQQIDPPEDLHCIQEQRVRPGDFRYSDHHQGRIDAHAGSDAKDRFDRGPASAFETYGQHVRHVRAGWYEEQQDHPDESG